MTDLTIGEMGNKSSAKFNALNLPLLLPVISTAFLVIAPILVIISFLSALVPICKMGSVTHLATQDCYENNKEIAHKFPSVFEVVSPLLFSLPIGVTSNAHS